MDARAAAKTVRTAAKKLGDLASPMSKGEDVRAAIEDVLADVNVTLTRLYGPRTRAPHGQGGQGKMLEYLKQHPHQWVEGDELAQVARIKTFARRLRELRVEHGWRIEEDDGRYQLLSLTPDTKAAEKWRLANSIRRRDGSGKSRIAAYLEATVGEIVDRDQLDYVAKIKEGSRRWRELRDEDGWPIESSIDNPELGVSEYRLVSADPADRRDPRQRLYPEGLKARIFERDQYTCQKCGRDRAAAEAAGDTRFFLEVHHRKAVAEQLDALPQSELNDPDNLVTYCHADHVKETAEFQRRRRDERSGS